MKKRASKGIVRSLISGAGIIIGMAVLLTIVGIHEGGRLVMNNSYWNNNVRVYDISLGDFASEGDLVMEDTRQLVDKMPEVIDSMAVLKLDARLKSYKAAGTAHTLAVDEEYLRYANLQLLKGSFINGEDVRKYGKVAVIDDFTAIELFGTKDIIGQKLNLQTGGKEVEFTVKGIVKNFNKNIETLFEDEIAGVCFIPNSVPEDASLDAKLEKVVAMVDSSLHEEEAVVRLSHLLEREHGTIDAYNIKEYNQLPQVKEFTDKYLVFGVIVAIVGLISGGIGLLNMMLLTIRERKKEIGLYVFYGSGTKELQYDVIYRSVAACLIMGMLGLVSGTAAGAFIGGYINIGTRFTLLSIFITIAASAAVGIIISFYPASRIKHVDVSESIWGE